MDVFIRIDKSEDLPLYLQVRAQIIAAIARGELAPGEALPSVRMLASDLGINLHTVNKAYVVLRDEGYIAMRGRAGATVANRPEDKTTGKLQIEKAKMEEHLLDLALAHRARGGTQASFIEYAKKKAAQAFEGKE